ncbi:YibE/F family protein [Methanocaldococcus indicus]|uniref:YibE/F family protein n=1 Tax=Methanocaldococcus indicus TaxID=213231 RepID=UPI003C6CE746
MKVNSKIKLELIFLTLVTIFSIFIILYSPLYKNTNDYYSKKGVVIKTEDNLDYNGVVKIGFQDVWVKLYDSGKVLKFSNVLRGNWLLDNYFEKGDNVLVIYKKDTPIYLTYDRVEYFLYFILMFLGLILIIGQFRGFKTAISLLFTVVMIFYILLPLIINGYSPITLTITIIGIIIFVCFFILCGFNKKVVSSSLGTILGIVVSGLLGYIGIKLMKLPPGGFSEFVQMILFTGYYMDFYGILISSIILASLGAIMDVAIDISSGLYEIKRHKPDISFKELFESGMNIGKDIMGTMANTLILVYVGSLIAPILYFMIKGTPIDIILSYNFIASEILASLCGSIGIVLTIPLTALIAAYLYSS